MASIGRIGRKGSLSPKKGPKGQNSKDDNKTPRSSSNEYIFKISAKLDQFSLSYSVLNFWPTLAKEGSPGPKYEKNTPGICLKNMCIKFQPNPTIFGLSRLPQSVRTNTHTDSSPTEVENNNCHRRPHSLVVKMLTMLKLLSFASFFCLTAGVYGGRMRQDQPRP